MGKVINISEMKTKSLYNIIDGLMRPQRRKGISYSITAYSNDLANIRITVTGLSGSSTKTVLLKYDTLLGWQAYYDNQKEYLETISELSVIARKIVQRLQIIIRKI